MQKCPACRARYKGEILCARCGADLTLPLLSEQQAEDCLRRAIQLLANDDRDSAAAEIQQSLLLKQIPLAASLNAFLKTERHIQAPQTHNPLQDWLSSSKKKWDHFHPDLSIWKKQVLRWQRKGAH